MSESLGGILGDDKHTVHVAEHQVSIVDNNRAYFNRAAVIHNICAYGGILRPAGPGKNGEILTEHLWGIPGITVKNCSDRTAGLCRRGKKLTPQGTVVCAGGDINIVFPNRRII